MRGDDGGGLWRLEPGHGAPEAIALLGSCWAFVEGVAAEIASATTWCDGECVSEETTLGLCVRISRAMLAAQVELAEVPGPTRVAMTASAVDPIKTLAASLPPLWAAAARRLTPGVVQRMLGLEEQPLMLFAIYVDEQLAPFVPSEAPAADCVGELDTIRDMPAVLAELQRSPLLVQLRVGGRRKLFRIDMARAWIYTLLDPQGSSVVHRSSWGLAPVVERPRATPRNASLGAAICVPATCERRLNAYRQVEVAPPSSGGSDLWGRIALTPIALLIDCALIPLYACGGFLSGEDDDDCDRPDTVHDPVWRRRAKRR